MLAIHVNELLNLFPEICGLNAQPRALVERYALFHRLLFQILDQVEYFDHGLRQLFTFFIQGEFTQLFKFVQ